MNILVLATAATEGGALSILKQQYTAYSADSENYYYICTGADVIGSGNNIEVLDFRWTKNSWFHRIYFELVYINKLLKDNSIDRIISLQNIGRNGKLPVEIYLHQSLPFANYRFELLKNPRLWVYQNVMSKIIKHDIVRADKVIVQTNWFAQLLHNNFNIPKGKISIMPPKLSDDLANYSYRGVDDYSFFYPAAAYPYKNHSLIIQALDELKILGKKLPTIYVTITAEELSSIGHNDINEDIREHFVALGPIDYFKVLEYLSKYPLIFPSYIETYGLPLAEARAISAPIVASDTNFSHEVLLDYEKVTFFNPHDAKDLAKKMDCYANSEQGLSL